MTGGFTRPISMANFGGVTYDENSLVKKWTTTENGKTQYHLRLKPQYDNHTYRTIKVSYPEQKKENGSKVLLKGTSMREEGCPKILVSDLAHGNIVGSQDNDQFILEGCNGTTLDISNDNRKDRVTIRDSQNHKSCNNVVLGGGNPATYNNGDGINDEATIVKDSYKQTFEFEPGAQKKLKETQTDPTIDYRF